ncbi:MAG: hypothetical protein HOY79_54615 [Streptomyces sp.]|nr:hypothetical protein [Streptomyces sp.]
MALRVVLGALLTAMALGQLVSFPHMPAILSAYGIGGRAPAAVLAAVLIAGELAGGLWFLARPQSPALPPVWAYTAVSVAWSALAAQAFARGLTVPRCGCFGTYASQHLSWIVLVEDALMLLYAVILLRSPRH